MFDTLPPGLLLMLGALLIPVLPRSVCGAWTLFLPALGLAHMLTIPDGVTSQIQLFSYDLTLCRMDALSRIFGVIFHIAAFLCALYALHIKDKIQHMAGLLYAGSAIAAVFAGDLVSLFVWWELTAITSVFLIWAKRTEKAFRAGMRYLLIQVGSGVLLLSGILLKVQQGDGIWFGHFGPIDDVGTLLIFVAVGIKCAFPFLHNWLQDAYPEATVTGTVFLSVFTTKLAIYVLARGFAGTHMLIYIGVIMTLFPIFFAVIENDLRRVLAYSLNNQLGFMVVGIGIGTELALNGTVAHAFCHILYKSLLFMSMGAVLYRTGTIKASELGGLYKSMPFTTVFCIIGAASISAFPLFSGFVSKSLILSAVAEHHYVVVWLLLLVASAGVMEHSGIKIPFFAFFAHDSGRRVKEAPFHMLLAMGIGSVFCIGIGVFPQVLYHWLPYDVEYQPYTPSHVLTQLQLLMFAVLAFVVLLQTRTYPAEQKATNLDTDWFYRKAYPEVIRSLYTMGSNMGTHVLNAVASMGGVGLAAIKALHDPRGMLGRTWTTSTMVLFAAVLLCFYLVMYLLH